MDFRFDISGKFKKMANWHVSQTVKSEDAYLKMSISEYELFKNFVGSPKKILELGCGLGRMSVFLNSKLQDPSIHFILADTTRIVNNRPRFGWDHGEDFYNDLSLTKEFAENHGLFNFDIFDVKKQNIKVLKDIDFIISFLAIGFHSQIEYYIDDLMQISTDNCVMVFGVRKNKYSEDSFKEYFNEGYLFENDFTIDGKETKENILILKDKKVR